MTTIFDWPANVIPRDVLIKPPRKTIGGGASLGEIEQVVPSVRPPFGLTLQFDHLIEDEVLAWRALIGSLEGRANVVRVPLFDLWLSASRAALGYGLIGHSDGTGFSDGAMYLTSDLSGVLVTGVQGQRTITVDFGSYGQIIQPGQFFGLGERPYLATGISWAGAVATIRCNPSLRQNYTAQPLRLKPSMLARLVDDDGGLAMLDAMRSMKPTIEFREAFGGTLP